MKIIEKKFEKDSKGLYYVIDIRNKTAKEIQIIISNYNQDQLIIAFNEKYDSKQPTKEYERQNNFQQHFYNIFTIYEKNR